ncbi:MAG: adenylate/guanylate cyclase domain-containing protein [Burkholderiaceae bacterium]
MTAKMSALTRVQLRLYLRILCASAAIGVVYAFVVTTSVARSSVGSVLVTALIGAIDGTIIGSSSAFDFFVLRRLRARWLDAQPLVALIALRVLVYGGMAAAVSIGQPGEHLFGLASPFIAHKAAVTIGFSLAVSTVLMVLFQAAALVGHRTFLALVLGKYRQPSAERRYFLFVDVVGSTAIAERLGPHEAHRFLAAVFRTVAEPIALCRGEIYQYVGDEIVVTWTEAEGTREARSLRCCFEMRAALAAASQQFRERFGVDPALRAALHLGDVIAGEVGEARRAIVFHGDAMNTAGRLEQATRELDCRFIASADALTALGALPGLRTHDLGTLALRGRVQPVHAYCVEGYEAAATV